MDRAAGGTGPLIDHVVPARWAIGLVTPQTSDGVFQAGCWQTHGIEQDGGQRQVLVTGVAQVFLPPQINSFLQLFEGRAVYGHFHIALVFDDLCTSRFDRGIHQIGHHVAA